MKAKKCVHRFVQVRWKKTTKWRFYCVQCGRWMKEFGVYGPDLSKIGESGCVVVINPELRVVSRKNGGK